MFDVFFQEQFFGLELLRIGIIITSLTFCAYLVNVKKVKVNYARKILHFGYFFSAVMISQNFGNFEIDYLISSLVTNILAQVIFIHQIRRRVKPIAWLFAAYDRPEDRPYTLTWFVLQMVAGSIVIIISAFVFEALGIDTIFLSLTVVINAVGDGMAEPIGVRFGKHKYETSALFTAKKYQRSFEGSATVFFGTIICVLFYASYLSTGVLIFSVTLLPVLMTITEAKSPHTFDTPTMYFVGNVFFLVASLV